MPWVKPCDGEAHALVWVSLRNDPRNAFAKRPTHLTASMKPLALEPGDPIAVFTPASSPPDAGRFHEGIRRLERLGHPVECVPPSPHRQRGYLAGTDAERLDDLNGLLQRDDLKMLLATRGGYGSLRLLANLDYEAARRHPKLIVGYSDVTALQMALYRHAGCPSLSGPMVAPDWWNLDSGSEALFWDLALGGTPDPLTGPAGERLQPLLEGRAEGVLLGGNLSLIVRLLGTPYLPSLQGAILFVEDVGEEPYRIDAMLAQLKLAGLLDKLGGLVLGGFTEWESSESPPPQMPEGILTPEEVFEDYIGEASYPVASGLAYGHFPVKNTVPIGVRARLEVTSGAARLSILEPVVAHVR